ARYHHDRAEADGGTRRFEYAYRAQDVGLECPHRIVIRGENDRLCGQVEKYIGLELQKRGPQCINIIDVADAAGMPRQVQLSVKQLLSLVPSKAKTFGPQMRQQ